MKLDRRSFLKLLGSFVAVAAAPAISATDGVVYGHSIAVQNAIPAAGGAECFIRSISLFGGGFDYIDVTTLHSSVEQHELLSRAPTKLEIEMYFTGLHPMPGDVLDRNWFVSAGAGPLNRVLERWPDGLAFEVVRSTIDASPREPIIVRLEAVEVT